jgi:hypothetical protein
MSSKKLPTLLMMFVASLVVLTTVLYAQKQLSLSGTAMDEKPTPTPTYGPSPYPSNGYGYGPTDTPPPMQTPPYPTGGYPSTTPPPGADCDHSACTFLIDDNTCGPIGTCTKYQRRTGIYKRYLYDNSSKSCLIGSNTFCFNTSDVCIEDASCSGPTITPTAYQTQPTFTPTPTRPYQPTFPVQYTIPLFLNKFHGQSSAFIIHNPGNSYVYGALDVWSAGGQFMYSVDIDYIPPFGTYSTLGINRMLNFPNDFVGNAILRLTDENINVSGILVNVDSSNYALNITNIFTPIMKERGTPLEIRFDTPHIDASKLKE